jgi:murein DD-endopeptidase MepM/ murein hydrolase activator NlpD
LLNIKEHIGLVTVTVGLAIAGSTALLFFEYAHFKDEVQKLSRIRKEYKNFMRRYKAVLEAAHSNGTYVPDNEVDEDSGESEDTEQDEEAHEDGFAEYEGEPSVAMLVINRDPVYLKDSALEYARLYALHDHIEKIYYDQVDLPLLSDVVEAKRKRFTSKQRVIRRMYASPIVAADAPLFICPLQKGSFWISSLFGWRKRKNTGWRFHHGIDLAAIKGTAVYAAADGYISQANRSNKGYGNCVVITHNQKYKTRYAHLNSIVIQQGQMVKAGQKIGTVGSTGLVVGTYGRDSASHLHFEVEMYSKRSNPLWIVQ